MKPINERYCSSLALTLYVSSLIDISEQGNLITIHSVWRKY